MKLYHWTRCSTCRQVRESLLTHELKFDEHDIFAQPLDRQELTELVRLVGSIRPLVSVASPTFRQAGRTLQDYSEAELFALVLAEPRALRRPLLVTDSESVLIGKEAIFNGLSAHQREKRTLNR